MANEASHRLWSGGVRQLHEEQKLRDAARRNYLPKCYKCNKKQGNRQCDFITGEVAGHPQTCGKYLCADHFHHVPATDKDYCYEHYVVYREQKKRLVD